MSPTTVAPILIAAEPEIFVADIAAACRHYGGTLGFAVAFTDGEPPFHAQLIRGGARLNPRCVNRPAIDRARRDREERLSAAITPERVEPLFRGYQAAGARFFQTLRDEPSGARAFIVRDADDNLLLFAGPAEPQAEAI